MDVYIVFDMECISGITSGGVTRTGHSEWAQRGCVLATDEVNTAIEGALAAGAQRIYVKDGHDSGENLLRERLHPGAELISGSTASNNLLPSLNDSFDVMFLIGFHARMGTLHAHFDHTISTATVSEIRLNGTPVGEIGIYAAQAALYGVPLTLVTGDAAATREARDLLGEIETVSVKEAYGRFAARTLAPEVVRPKIREAAQRATHSRIQPWRLDAPLTVEVEFLRSAEADMAELVPGARREGARLVAYSQDDPEMSFKALQAMVSLGGIAASRWARQLYTTGAPVT